MTNGEHPKPGSKSESACRRLVVIIAAIGAGWLLSHIPGLTDFSGTNGYLYGATTLLAVGLFGSTTEISLLELRSNARIVIAAVTVGVVLKASLITAVMYLFYPDNPAFLVLGVAMAQIDPLSVAALRQNSRLSERAKAILSAWSSFDDPVTTLLTIYATALALNMMGRTGTFAIGDASSFFTGLLWNLLLAVAAGLSWWLLKVLAGQSFGCRDPLPGKLNALAVALLVVMVGVAAWQALFLGLAAAGLIFRPQLGEWLTRATQTAFYLASVGLGMLLLDGVNAWAGVILGVSAFVAQILVSSLLTLRLSSVQDRAYLAVSQQNGITAIILALVLEQNLPGVARVIAPAILVVNILHILLTPRAGALGARLQASKDSRRAQLLLSPALETAPSNAS